MGQGSFIKGLQRLFGARASIDEDFFDDMADTLVEGDLGAKIAYELIDEAKRAYKAGRVTDSRGVLEMVTASISPWVREITLEVEPSAVTTFLVLGVNGVGKTTSVAKMARWYASMHNLRVTMAACDTFRAAAIEQLQRHGESLGLRVIAHQHGSDPGAVVFSACEAARASGGGLVLADTAGRLHNKENLVRNCRRSTG
jgi:fused signal recognition particle receptor